MNKKIIAAVLMASLFLQSCATVFGGRITECQRHKPAPGKPRRSIRPVALAADIVLLGAIGVGIDFLTHAIYRPCGKDVVPMKKK